MKGIGTRVQVLERQQLVECAICRWWDRTVVVSLDTGGYETGRSRPDHYPECGRDVAVEHVVEIVGVPWEVV